MGSTKYYLSRIPNHVFLIYLLSSRRFLFGPLDIGSSCTVLYISGKWDGTSTVIFLCDLLQQTNLTSQISRERKRGEGVHLDRRLSLATPNILTASNPALVALLTATVATGTPFGICTINEYICYEEAFRHKSTKKLHNPYRIVI